MAEAKIGNRYEPLYALFHGESKTALDKARLAAALEFMNAAELNNANRNWTSERLFDETVGYLSRLDRALAGEGPLEGVGGDFLNAAGLAIDLRGGGRMKAAKEVAQAVGEFSFVKHWLADAKELDAAQNQAAFSQHYAPLLKGKTQSWWETARGSQRLREAAGKLTDIGKIPELPVNDGEVDVSTAGILTFTDDDVISVTPHADKVFADGKRNADGSLTVAMDKLQKALKEDFKALSGDLHEATGKILEELAGMRAQQQTVVDWVESQKKAEAQRKQDEENVRRRTALVDAAVPALATAEAGLGALVTLIGLGDPKVAKQIAAVGGALISVTRAGIAMVQAAVNVADVAGKVITAGIGLAMAACTFNFIGAAAALVSLFIPSGPSPEEMILEEIQKLREEMRAFQVNVNERFDRIDKALTRIYVDVMSQLDKIDLTTREIAADVKVVLGILAEHSRSLDRIERNLLTYIQEVHRAELKDAMASALLRPRRSNNPVMTGAEYQNFEAVFFNWATVHSRGALESPAGPTTDADLARVLDPHGDGGANLPSDLAEHLALLVRATRDRGWVDLAPNLNQTVPNPRTWMIACAAFTQLELEWPGHAARFNSRDLDGRRRLVRKAGEEIVSVLNRVGTAKGAQNRTALDLAAERVRERGDRLAVEIEEAARRWTWLGCPLYVSDLRADEPDLIPPVPEVVAGAAVPVELVRRIPPVYRALAALGDPPRGGLKYTAMPIDQKFFDIDEREWHARLTLTLTWRNVPIQRVAVWGTWKTGVPASLVQQWPTWVEKLSGRDGTPEVSDIASPTTARTATEQWKLGRRWVRERVMLPQLVKQMSEQPLATPLAEYAGARALLSLMIGLSAPTARQRDDRVRAALDGMPKYAGGVGVPTPVQIQERLLNLGSWAPADPATRLLEAHFKQLINDSVTPLARYLAARGARAKARQASNKSLDECFGRLQLSRQVVHAVAIEAGIRQPIPS